MVALRFTRIPPHPTPPQAITKACAARGMLLLTAGARECVRFLPPLTLSAAEADLALSTFREAVLEVLPRAVEQQQKA